MAKMPSGKYKGKTTNLSAKELKTAVSSAGGKKVGTYKKNLGAATKVNISNTDWVEGKGLVNKTSPGTRITGTVTLGTGEKATYVNGRRLRASAAKPAGSGNGKNNLTDAQKASLASKAKDIAAKAAKVAEMERQKNLQKKGPSSVRPMSQQGKKLMEANARQLAYVKKQSDSKKSADRNPLQKIGDWAAEVQGGSKKERLITSLRGQLQQKQREAEILKNKKAKTAAEQRRQNALDAEIRRLKSQL
jgi:hypothetical protein